MENVELECSYHSSLGDLPILALATAYAQERRVNCKDACLGQLAVDPKQASRGQRTILALYSEDPISSPTRVKTSHPCVSVHSATKFPRKKVLAFLLQRV
jgi:hypothetical protein